MTAVRAWEKLNDRDTCSQMAMEELHETLLLAGYPPREAQRIANQRGWDRLSAGAEM